MCIKPLKLPDRTVKCTQCIQCLIERSQEWSFRVEEESRDARSGVFITLTYDDNSAIWVDTENGKTLTTLDKRDYQLFMKRLRHVNKKYTTNASIPVRYFACGEYGETLRAHYHGIIFNLENEAIEQIPLIWGKGWTDTKSVNSKAIRYVTNYMLLKYRDIEPEQEKPFTLMSRNPGLGASYIQRNFNRHFVDGNHKLNHASKHQRNLYRYYTDKTMDEKTKYEARLKKCEEYEKFRQEQLKEAEKKEPLDPLGYLKAKNDHKAKISKKRQKKRL